MKTHQFASGTPHPVQPVPVASHQEPVRPYVVGVPYRFRCDVLHASGAQAAGVPDAPRCPAPAHHNTALWQDHTPANGRIKTTCRKCGGFIGYRPLPGKSPTNEPNVDVDDEQLAIEQQELFE